MLQIAALTLALTFAPKVTATDIPIGLGPPGHLRTHASHDFSELDGTALSGQTLSVDFLFSNNQFVRLFTTTTDSFSALVTLDTNGSGDLGSDIHGTGLIFDSGRNALQSPETLGAASGDDASLSVGLLPLLSGPLQRPVDFFGVHLDMTLPDLTQTNPSLIIIGGEFELIASHINGDDLFGVGPGVPPDIVPDTGRASLLLAIGLVSLIAIGLRLGPSHR